MLGIFKRRKVIKLKSEDRPEDSKHMLRHKNKILGEMEDLLTTIVKVKKDNRLSSDEKYAVIMSSLISLNKVTIEVINSDKLFKEKEFDEIKDKLEKMYSYMDDKPSYTG